MSLQLLSLRTGEVVVEELVVARSVRARMRGLIGRPALRPSQALLLAPCKQVHTFGMTVPIDVIFCDGAWTVLHVVRGMVPRRVSRLVLRARSTIELLEGGAAPVAVGDQLKIEGRPA